MIRAVRAEDLVRTTVVLDADGLSKLARRDRRTREMIRTEVAERGSVVVAPPVIVIQALAEGVGRRAVDEVLATTRESGLDRARIDLAVALLQATRTHDVPDALVAAEALLRVPAIIITSDPDDLRRLLDADPRAARVIVWRV